MPGADSVTNVPFGATQDGQAVTLYTLRNDHGVTVKFLSYGGIITEIDTPDRSGRVANIVLGCKTLRDYETLGASIHFGALIGRYANRIARARFELDGHCYQLAANDDPNTLHGGRRGFDKVVWSVTPRQSAGSVEATLCYRSPDGEEGFPGALDVAVTYTLSENNDFRIDYVATTDQRTVLNLTNHSYFNLAGNGSGSVERQRLRVDADRYTPVDATLIPNGELAPVAGTPLDFRRLTPLGAHLRSGFGQIVLAHGYDHNFVLNGPRGGEPALAAEVRDPDSGRILEVLTNQPGLQVYTGNFLDGSVVGSADSLYRQGDAFALETQHFPDSPNHPSFPTTELRPGQTFRSSTIFRFRVDAS